MGVVDEGRRLKTYNGVEIFRITLWIQVELSCLAVLWFIKDRCN